MARPAHCIALNNPSSLHARLLAAHGCGDKYGLIGLYAEASAAAENIDAACFFLTHAYVYALELGDARADEFHSRLKRQGRET